MRILHVAASVAPVAGGPSIALGLFVEAGLAAGLDVEVLTTDASGLVMPPWTRSVPVQVEHANMALPLDPSLGLFFRLLRDARRYDVIHVHGLWLFHSLASTLATLPWCVPIVLRPCGGLSAFGYGRRQQAKRLYFHAVERRVIENACVLHFLTEGEFEQSRPHFSAPLPWVLPTPVRIPTLLTRAEARALLGVPDSAFLILSVGRLNPIKNLHLLIEALEFLPQDTHLVLVGPNEFGEEPKLRALAVRLHLSKRVTFTGLLDVDAIDVWHAAADACASASSHENFGIAIAEACAAGRPSVVPRDIFLAHELGHRCVAVERSPQALAAGLSRLRDPAIATDIAVQARDFAVERWSVKATAPELSRMYAAAVDERRHRGSKHGRP